MRRQAYDIFVRGSLGPEPEVGRPLFRRVPTDELDTAVAGLVAGWLDRRSPGEGFVSFARRASKEGRREEGTGAGRGIKYTFGLGIALVSAFCAGVGIGLIAVTRF